MEKAVFFDRDGTLVTTADYGEQLHVAPRNTDDLKLLPKAPRLLRRLHQSGYLLIVISNQPDIALNQIDELTRQDLEKKFRDLLEEKQATIDEVIYCHHHPNSVHPNYPKECDCRKPKPGMILDAAKRRNIDLEKSWVIGDKDKDILAGTAVGCKTILLDNHWSNRQNCQPDFIITQLDDIASIVLQTSLSNERSRI